jgi:hypothetical protein
MKRVAQVIALFASLCGLLLAQKPSQHLASSPSIEISGVRLHLGMTEAEVAKSYVGTQIARMSDEDWGIGRSGSVRFKNHILVFAGRSWLNSGEDQIDALFNVVSSLNKEGYLSCKVASESVNVPVTDPDTGRILDALSAKGEKVWIVCGKKSVLIVKMKTGDRLYEDVMEQLGVIPLGRNEESENENRP